ncbi:ABC transporter permease [Streptomyces sp. NPDC002659]|uniref:ABC transporter permease n=1 Tax=Streptomyces sp. NPDC002659 TaxID=3364656 RepID=UPI00368B9E94
MIRHAGSGRLVRERKKNGAALTARVASRFLGGRALLLLIIGLFIALSLSSNAFLTPRNLLNMAEQNAPLAIIAAAGTMVIISGGFDISVGAVFVLAGVIAARVANATSPFIGILTAVLSGTFIGTLNGSIVAVVGVNSLITTLATGILVRGIAILLTHGYIITVAQPDFAILGTAEFLHIRYSIWTAMAFVGAAALLLHASIFGRYLFAIGSNQTAAIIAGVRVGLTRTIAFAISGASAALAGTIVASNLASGQPGIGTGLEFSVLTAIIVGGTSIAGGDGAIWRTLAGVVLLALIDNGVILLGFDPIYVQIIQGAIILAAVCIDTYSRHTHQPR